MAVIGSNTTDGRSGTERGTPHCCPRSISLRPLIQDIYATRYAFLDAPRFASAPDPVPTGFQWIVYRFSIDAEHDVSLISLHGLQDTPLDSRSYISKDGVRIWDGGRDGYKGEYFCFEGERYLGTWDGQPGSASPARTRCIGSSGIRSNNPARRTVE